MTPDNVLMQAFKGDADAVQLARLVNRVAETWDDLIDGDPVSAQGVNAAFIAAMAEIPANPFYRRHESRLAPVIASAVTHWLIANRFERDGDAAGLERAHVLRYLGVAVWVSIAECIGGIEWAAECGATFWRSCTMESLAEYRREQLREVAA